MTLLTPKVVKNDPAKSVKTAKIRGLFLFWNSVKG